MNSINSTYIIRRAERNDLSAISDIYNYEVANGTATFDIHPSTMPELETWFAAHNVDNHPLIVIETEGQVAGYASLSKYRDKEAYAGTVELSVYVGYEFRGRGYAKALVSELIGMAKRDPATHVIVSVITGGNDASVSLHRHFGFTFCGTIHETGFKFGRYLSIDNYELIVG